MPSTPLIITSAPNGAYKLHSDHPAVPLTPSALAVTARQCLDAAVENEQSTHVFVGHVHEQALYYQGSGHSLMPFTPTAGVPVPLPRHRSWVATIGSVGQPRDGDPRAMYAIYDDTVGRLTFHRVPYDHAAAAAAIRRAGLPEFFASRLEEGR